jgi:tRNA threonylcarbamoyladenosine biosynthesis protein TsaB
MSIILHIETSTKACSVALAEGGYLLASDFRTFEHYAHAETLNPMIQEVMQKAKRNFKDLEAISVSSGPGSYTGLRIGISSAKGFCYGLEIPLIAISSLEIMAAAAKNYEGKHENAVLVPMMDARRMEVYSATFDKDLKRLDNDKAIIVDENFTKRFEGEKIYYFGDGMPKCFSILESDPRSVFIDAIYPDAKNMIQISLVKFRNSEFENLAYFEPEYLKEFNSHK